MPIRTIKAVYYAYVDEKGTHLSARRGSTVDIPEGYYLDRGDRLGMFIESDTQRVLPITDELGNVLNVTDVVADQVTQAVIETPVIEKPVLDFDQIADQNGPEVIAYVEAHPETAEAVLAVEQAKGDKARSTVVAALTKLIEG